MAYTLEIGRPAAKFLRNLTDKHLYLRMREALNGLEINPRPSGYVKLQGGEELYRIRVGDYRIVYQIQDRKLVVLVVQIGHRREIYR